MAEIRLIDFTDETRDRIKRTITREYTPERTGIHFTGWQECRQDPKAVPIYCASDKNQGSAASLGTGGHFKSRKREVVLLQGSKDTPYVFLSLQENPDELKDRILMDFLTVHEFGHLAGLRHEHIRPEAENDPNCNFVLNNRYDESLIATSAIVGPYGPNSIMNYCWAGTLANFGTDFYIHERQAQVTDESQDHELDKLPRPKGTKGARLTPFKVSFLDWTLLDTYESVDGTSS